MPRPQRTDYPGAWHHVINRGIDHAPIFFTDGDRTWFLYCLQEACEEHCVEVHGYCLMGNHCHLLVRSLAGELSTAMQWLSARYTQGFNKHHQRDGPLFRGRYTAMGIATDWHLLVVSRYIHLNPVQAGLVRDVRHYRWSSASAYLGAPRPEWLVVEELLALFPGDPRGLGGYAAFLAAGTDERTRAFYASGRLRPVFQLPATNDKEPAGSDPFGDGV